MKYSNSFTMSYKSGYIFGSCIDNKEVIKVTVDKYAYIVYIKSIHAAKILITKHCNKVKGE